MARTPRKEVFREDEVGIYHCINRCVRRAFLCGRDPYTGKSFEHRKDWIRDRLKQLAGIFGIDVLGFAVLDNHLHVVLRNRPDVVAGWSDEEVARRWWTLFPQRKDQHGNALEPKDHDLQMLLNDAKALAERRRRLSHISWFMRCLCETIARCANREDGCSGRFFQGRFRCISIEDESALLACSMYVDLNPIRAGIAKTPETSPFTSAYERIMARKDRQRPRRAATSPGRRCLGRDAWLSPIPLGERGKTSRQTPLERASNEGFLPLDVDEYLTLLDWTGRQVRREKTGTIPADLKPILERLQIVSECWVEMVKNFGRWFRRAAGRPESLCSTASRRGRRWLHGLGRSRLAFA